MGLLIDIIFIWGKDKVKNPATKSYMKLLNIT